MSCCILKDGLSIKQDKNGQVAFYAITSNVLSTFFFFYILHSEALVQWTIHEMIFVSGVHGTSSRFLLIGWICYLTN